MPMSVKEAREVVGGLTRTSKMPCVSYSLPTIACQTGFKLSAIAGSVCSECYAKKNFYRMYEATIEPAQVARLMSLDDPQWVEAMVILLLRELYMRWHDSGDIQSIEHLELIVEVARRTPHCDHWLPTREYGIVSAYLAQYGDFPPNLTVRLSALFPDKPTRIPASIPRHAVAVSNVHSKKPGSGFTCGAPTRGGKCGDCRACWDRSIDVSYKLH